MVLHTCRVTLPRSGTHPSGKLMMKSWALACCAALTTSAKVAERTPKEMLSRMVVQKRTGFWLTSWGQWQYGTHHCRLPS